MIRRLVPPWLSALSLIAGWCGTPALASPAAPEITIDHVLGKVAGWSIGYSASLDACLAAAVFRDGTTVWLGISRGSGQAFLAFSNAKWRSIEPGQSYDIRLRTREAGLWHGNFAGFDRDGNKGVFTSGLKEQFVSDLAATGGLDLSLGGRHVTSLSLVGSSDAMNAIGDCLKSDVHAPAPDGRPSNTVQAQQEAMSHLRVDRLAAARGAAGRAIDDAAGFVKANADDPHVLDFVQRITDLRVATAADDPGQIERATAAMASDLKADPAYQAYEARVSVERQRENAHYLDEAMHTLGIQKGVLVQALIQDPTSSLAGDYLSLEKQAAAALAAPDLEQAKTVIGLIDAVFAKGRLNASYELAKANAAKTGTAAEAHP